MSRIEIGQVYAVTLIVTALVMEVAVAALLIYIAATASPEQIGAWIGRFAHGLGGGQ